MEDFPEEPFPLVEFESENDKLQVNMTALNLLKQIRESVCVVAMAGLYRTGKSSMLNWLMGRQRGFRVGPTVERCTRGIWIWGKPRKIMLPSGKHGWILILDTEGLGGLEASQQYDLRIFSLATLLCSKLIYNSQGSIDEKAINGLSFIANITKHIRVKADSEGDSDDDGSNFQKFFPSFLWIVRDFTLELVDEDGDAMTSNEYLEKALSPQSGLNPATLQRNRVRQMMTSFFQDRECFTIVRPVHKEEDLQQVDKLSISELRPEFQSQLCDLKLCVFNALKPKMLNGQELNGEMFSELLLAYVEAINMGSVPTISSAWEEVTAGECRRAMNEAVLDAKSEIDQHSSKNKFPMNEDQMEKLISTIESNAMAFYNKNSCGEASIKYGEELRKRLKSEFDQLKEMNSKESADFSNRLLHEIYCEKIQENLLGKSYYNNTHKFAEDWRILKSQYITATRGPSALVALSSFTEQKLLEVMKVLLSQQDDMYQEKLRIKDQKQAEIEQALSLAGGKEKVYMEQIDGIQNEAATITSERARLQAETEAQDSIIDSLKQKIEQGENETEDFVKSNLLLKEKLEVQQENHKKDLQSFDQLKQLHSKLLMEKERQDVEIGMLTEENEALRKGSACGACNIS